MTSHRMPFGLTYADPVERTTVTPGAGGDRRPVQPRFDGRPLTEHITADTPPSAPTEKDGKDPINVDSDPFYD